MRGPVEPKLFTYLRYNAELSNEWLRHHQLGHIRARDVQALDSTAHMAELSEVGRKAAEQVERKHFAGFLARRG